MKIQSYEDLKITFSSSNFSRPWVNIHLNIPVLNIAFFSKTAYLIKFAKFTLELLVMRLIVKL